MARHDWRTGAESRCCDPTGAPYRWVDRIDPADGSVVAFEAWMATLTPFARAVEDGRIEELLETAAQGLLEDSGDQKSPIKPIRTHPDIYELRIKCLSKAVRMYHAEPDAEPDALVALHRHFKGARGLSQQDEIEHAVGRYGDGA